jgi:hypothetical protein
MIKEHICPFNQMYQYFNQNELDMFRVKYMWIVPNKCTQFLTRVNQHYISKLQVGDDNYDWHNLSYY